MHSLKITARVSPCPAMSEDERKIITEVGAAGAAGDVDADGFREEAAAADDDGIETVDGLPVLAEVRPIERAPAAPLPAVQAAAVAATSFVAGVATLALVRRHTARKLARTQRDLARTQRDLQATRRPPFEMMPTVRSQRYIVDVHWIARPGE
jgi:hypothetical protein